MTSRRNVAEAGAPGAPARAAPRPARHPRLPGPAHAFPRHREFPRLHAPQDVSNPPAPRVRRLAAPVVARRSIHGVAPCAPYHGEFLSPFVTMAGARPAIKVDAVRSSHAHADGIPELGCPAVGRRRSSLLPVRVKKPSPAHP
jgi:hypothetical protein